MSEPLRSQELQFDAAGQPYVKQLNGSFKLLGASLPTADPHVVGALWADSGVVTVSAG